VRYPSCTGSNVSDRHSGRGVEPAPGTSTFGFQERGRIRGAPSRDGGNADPRNQAAPFLRSPPTQNRLSADGTRLVRLSGASDLPVVADCAGMQRQEGIALDVGGNGKMAYASQGFGCATSRGADRRGPASPYPPSTRLWILWERGPRRAPRKFHNFACKRSARLPTGIVVGQFALDARRYKAQ